MGVSLINFVSFYVGWVACVAGAGRGMTLVGPIVVAALLVVQLALKPHPAHEALLIVASGLLGWVVDTRAGACGRLLVPGDLAGTVALPAVARRRLDDLRDHLTSSMRGCAAATSSPRYSAPSADR